MKTGVKIISEERRRQITEKGYTFEEDDRQNKDQLALAAACYSIPYHLRQYMLEHYKIYLWPWESLSYKPSKSQIGNDRIHELAKAGALIAAEIDRLQRLKGKDNKNE